MNSFYPLNFPPDVSLLQISYVDVFNANSIRILVPYLKSILFGDFQSVFANASPEIRFRLLQLTYLTAQYFYFQTYYEVGKSYPQVASSIEQSNYCNLQQAFEQLKQENERLKKYQITPLYYKNMMAIKLANEQIRTENFKLKQFIYNQQKGAEYQCKACGKYFATHEYLQQHAQRRHYVEHERKASVAQSADISRQMVSSDQQTAEFKPITVSRIYSKYEQYGYAATIPLSIEAKPKYVEVQAAPSVYTEQQKTLQDSQSMPQVQSAGFDALKQIEQFMSEYGKLSLDSETENGANSIGEIM